MADRYDLVVIGAGPAGTSPRSARRSSGMKVACVEKRPTPRRHLPEHRLHPEQGPARLQRAVPPGPARVRQARHQGRRASTSTSPAMLARKDEVVKGLTDGVRVPVQEEQDHAGLRRRHGWPRPRPVVVRGDDGSETTAGGRAHPARHRQRADRAAVPDVRRQDHRQLDRGAGLRPRARAPDRRRRRLHRPGARLGLEAARGEGHASSSSCPGSSPIADGEIGDAAAQEPDQAGARVPPRDQGHRREGRRATA